MSNYKAPIYNILFIMNQKYFELSKICINSLLKNCDTENISKIFIADIGLESESINYFKKLSLKIEIINTGINISQTKDLHTIEWIDAVCMKTCILSNLTNYEGNLPLVLMDTDMFIVKDFSYVIDVSKDIQVCKREKPSLRSDMEMNYIASFFVVNNKNASAFILEWIKRIKERIELNTKPAYETPALCETIEKYENKITIGFLNENDISCNNNYFPNVTSIIHMKSEGNEKENLLKGRIEAVKNFDHKKILSCLTNSTISEKDYIKYKLNRKSKTVIYTAIAGDYDKLIQHTYKSRDFDYICYTDQKIENPGIWEIRSLDFNSLDNVRNAKYYKVFPDKFFPEYDYSIWIDGNIDVIDDEFEKRIYDLINQKNEISVNIHGRRKCVYEEAYTCITDGKDNSDIIIKQIGFLKENKFPKNYGLFELNIIFREHNNFNIKKMMQDWWEIILKYSRRDQLSFPYVLYNNNIKCEQMFPTNARLRSGFTFEKHGSSVISSLFADTGSGFNASDLIMKSVTVHGDNKFNVTFNLNEFDKIKRLRFDPLNNRICKVKINKILVKGTENNTTLYDYKKLKSLIKSNGRKNIYGYISFKTFNPRIILKLTGDISEIEINGELKIFSSEKVFYTPLKEKIKKILKTVLPLWAVKKLKKSIFRIK